MKKKRSLLLAIVVVAALLVVGVLQLTGLAGHLPELVYRPLVGYRYDQTSGSEHMLVLDAQSGAGVPVALLNLEWAGVDQFAVDASGKTAYLGGKAPGENAWRLYTVNLSSGVVISSTLLDPGLGGFGFTSSTPGRLVAYDSIELTGPTRRVERLVYLDPASGVKTPITELDLEWVRTGTLTVDVPAQVAYLAGRKAGEDFWRLFNVNLRSGSVDDATVLDTGEGGFGLAAYTPGSLLAYRYQGGQGQVMMLDPATGEATIKVVFEMQFSSTGQFAADSFNKVAYLGARLPGETTWRMYVFDLAGGTATNDTILDTGNGGYGFNAFLQAWHAFAPLITK